MIYTFQPSQCMYQDRQDGAYLTPFVCPSLNAFPKCIDSFCYQLLHLRIGNTWLGVNFQHSIGVYNFKEHTMVTSKTSKVCGLIVPNRRWNRMECKVACRTSLAEWRSRICAHQVLIINELNSLRRNLFTKSIVIIGCVLFMVNKSKCHYIISQSLLLHRHLHRHDCLEAERNLGISLCSFIDYILLQSTPKIVVAQVS
jgi:hypothetical protein